MTPEQLGKPQTEHAQQVAFFCWCSQHKDERLKFIFAIPNGGERNKVQATRLVAEGTKKGVPDVFVPVTIYYDHDGLIVQSSGLWLEFKKPGIENRKNGGLKEDQIRFKDFLESQNYSHKIVYNYRQAINAVVEYLGLTQ